MSLAKKIFHTFCIFLMSGSFLFSSQEKEEPKQVVIFGSGVGALTSAVYLQRAGIETLVIEGPNPGGAIAQSPNVQNWPGELDIHGQALVEKIRKQAEENGAQFAEKEVISVDFKNYPLSITVRDVFDHDKVETIEAKTCIIAMGSMPKLLGIPGESGKEGYWTRGVYSCAVCDGSLYKGKTVAVIGGGDSAVLEADYLSKIAKKVYLILRSDQFRTVEILRKNILLGKSNVEVLYNTQIKQIQGNGTKVTHLNLSTENSLPIDGVFVAIGAKPNSELFQGQVEAHKNGYIRLVGGQQTSVPGVFAIGDIVDPEYKQAISAAGDGAKAALQVERYLSSNPNQQKVSEHIAFPAANKTLAGKVPELTEANAMHSAIGKEGLSLVVEFFSPSCGPCKQVEPELEKAYLTYDGKIHFLKVDVTQFSDLANTYNVYGVPSLLIFNPQGKVIKRASGYNEVHTTLNNLEDYTSQ